MEYALVNDDCDLCKYVTNAFTLLRLPLKKISIENFQITEPINMDVILICPEIKIKFDKKIDSILEKSETPLIFFEPTEQDACHDRFVQTLTPSFSQYELKKALINCANHKNNVPDFTDHIHPIFEKLLGQSKQICKIKSMIKQVAFSDATVLILGESGTGKDVIASCIHYASNRNSKPLVPINCGAIPGELMESELFGHEKGAFTGALSRRAGRFEIANEGTLFLDEIGDMPLPMQVKLLRVLQDRKITRIGNNTSIDVDVRLIAATNKNLEELIQSNQFREDLFYRLNVFPIQVPSLKERAEDIPILIDYHLEKIYERLKRRAVFTESAKEILCEYSWPGNIRELQNFLEKMVILYPDQVIDEIHIEDNYKKKKKTTSTDNINLPNETTFNISGYIANIEQQIIKQALDKSNGIIQNAAEYLSLRKSALMKKIKEYNLELPTDEDESVVL